jgi:hypothetical protein
MNSPSHTPTRPVPHIQYAAALETAAIAVANATDRHGKSIVLCANPFDVHHVADRMTEFAGWFVDPSFFFPTDGEGPDAKLKAVENLILLATLFREHLRAGNVT